MGPPKKKGADFVSEMFKRARESGAEAVEGSSAPGTSGASRGPTFRGTAFKLGSDETPSAPVADPRAAKKQQEPREFTLKMWQNGFSIDDGELRDYNDPRNRAFLASVMSGRIPEELVREARGGEVHVNMEDHKQEEYVRPKASAKPFQGTGNMLGGVVPAVTGASAAAPATPATPEANATNEAKAKEETKVRGSLINRSCTYSLYTVLVLRMAQRKRKDTKQQPGTAEPGNMLGCCLISFHSLWAILSTSTVHRIVIKLLLN